MRAVVSVTLVLGSLAAAAPAGAAPPGNLSDDGNGKRWRQLTQTTGLTPDQVAQVCPRDGETRCAGSVGSRDLTGWVWATGAQVRALMGLYEPAIVTADPPVVGGPEYLGSAMGFLEDMAAHAERHRLQLPPLVHRRLDLVDRGGRAGDLRKRRIRLVPDRRIVRRRAGHQP